MPSIIESKDTVEDDALPARESPALEDVRELISPGNDSADAQENATSPSSKLLDEAKNNDDSTECCDDAASSRPTNTIQQATTSDEASSAKSEAVALPEAFTVPSEAPKTDNAISVTQRISVEADNSLMESNPSAANVAASTAQNGETVHTNEFLGLDNACTLSPSATHYPSSPEALPTDNAGISLSPLHDLPVTVAEEDVALEKPCLEPSLMLSADVKTPKRVSPRKKSRFVSPAVTTPTATRTPKLLLSASAIHSDRPGETPQIGISLLRRESLRRKESPSKRKDARKSKTPKKRDTLQRRDTLQEREILQKVIAENTAAHGDELLDALPNQCITLTGNSPVPRVKDNMGNDAQDGSEPLLREEESDLGTVATVEALRPVIEMENVEKDLHRAIEAIEVYEHPELTLSSSPMRDTALENIQEMEAMDKANKVLAKTELTDVSQAMQATREQTPNQKTRSGARFSDDTSMLKDFLNRAQARKAAQKPLLSAPEAPIPQQSPRRSPRKTLGSQNGQSSMPERSRSIANRENTPPGKPKTEAVDSDDGEEATAEPASCRRSTRTRLPAPSKAPPGAPSFIPVRRADGTDPVVLQKSQAQELAVMTRANTRRNKGQSKPPLLALQDLPKEAADLESRADQRAEKGKTVAWAERLASYRDAKDEADDVEEKRPKVRRLRGLGAGNGTPAAKRTTAVVSTSNGTPAPKRRGKV